MAQSRPGVSYTESELWSRLGHAALEARIKAAAPGQPFVAPTTPCMVWENDSRQVIIRIDVGGVAIARLTRATGVVKFIEPHEDAIEEVFIWLKVGLI